MTSRESRPNPRVVLASASPRRADLLRQLGVPFEQVVSPDAEPALDALGAGEHALVAARAKARAVFGQLNAQAAHGAAENAIVIGASAIVIGADTVVSDAGVLLGKPRDEDEARRMLARLSGRTHLVYTGVVVLGPAQGEERSVCEVTEVVMRPLSEVDIADYVGSGEPLDKAGAYGIQGLGGRFIERISGCYYNVVGLPLARLSTLLEEAGYDFSAGGHISTAGRGRQRAE